MEYRLACGSTARRDSAVAAFAAALYRRKFFGEGVGIAVKKGNSQLRQTLDYALAALAARGTYTNLYLKYFPLGFY